MGKAIEGAAMLAGAVAMGALAYADPALIASPLYDHAMEALALGGLAMEAGAIAGALTSNRGQNITTRSPASFRQIIYGTQRVGGVIVYRSTTGSHKDQYNFIIPIASHECWAFQNIYLDGRQVFFNGEYAVTHNGITFGGNADGNNHTGPDGTQYNFGGKVFVAAYYGTQTNQPDSFSGVANIGGGFSTSMYANDPAWAQTSDGLPYLGGCTYIYLKVENDPSLFPGEPEIRVTVMGKPVYDPRTDTTAYSSNAALIWNDVFTDPQFGLGATNVNQAQLIAAANVCDEEVALAAGGTEARYACHWHFDTSIGVGDVLSTMMAAAAGKVSYIGGEWYLWPAYFQGSAASFDESSLTSPVQWSSTRSYKELFNRVTGTYIAPNYPYNPSGDLYDANGWYDGQIQNNFQFAFQPTNYPQYQCDVLHGYSSDQYFAEDGNVALPKELSLPCVLSIAQAQRLAKIALLRNRWQGTGSFQMSLAAYQLQPVDLMTLTFAANGWAGKLLEVNAFNFRMESGGNGGAPKILLEFGVNETDISVYEWSSSEELTVYAVAASPVQTPLTPAAPTLLTLTSSAATALTGLDGIVRPRVLVGWTSPLDGFVTQIQMQHQLDVTGAVWVDDGMVDVGLNAAYVSDVVSGQTYNFRIRSVRANGATSPWLESDAYTVSIILSMLTSTGINPNSPFNISNTATVDSIVESGAATIRIYGPGGDGSSFTRYQGASTSMMSGAHVTGKEFLTTYFLVYDTIGLVYMAFVSYNDTLADAYLFIGSCSTCSSDYVPASGGSGGTGSGGSGGGGGTAPGGGRNPLSDPVPELPAGGGS